MSTVLDQHSVLHGFQEEEAGGKGVIACAHVSERQVGQCQLAQTATAPNIGTRSITRGCSEMTSYIIFCTPLAVGKVPSLMEHALNS